MKTKLIMLLAMGLTISLGACKKKMEEPMPEQGTQSMEQQAPASESANPEAANQTQSEGAPNADSHKE